MKKNNKKAVQASCHYPACHALFSETVSFFSTAHLYYLSLCRHKALQSIRLFTSMNFSKCQSGAIYWIYLFPSQEEDIETVWQKEDNIWTHQSMLLVALKRKCFEELKPVNCGWKIWDLMKEINLRLIIQGCKIFFLFVCINGVLVWWHVNMAWFEVCILLGSLGSLVTHRWHSLSYGFRVEPFLPIIFASLLLSDASLISSSPHTPLMFLSRGFMTAVKPCTKAVTYGLLPHPPPSCPPSQFSL